MKPLHTVVALCLIATIRALPENIEEVKELPQETEPIVEADESETNTRTERCSSCSGKLTFKSPNEVLAALQTQPGAEVHTQQSFEECSSDKGCAGIKVKDGRVIERFGNPDSFAAAAAANLGNEFSFHAAGTFGNDVFQGGIPGNGPFWWMNQDSPFKNGGGNFEKFSKTESSSFSSSGTTGADGQIAGGANLGGNAFLGGVFGAGATGQGGQAGKGENFQSSSFESSSFSSNNGELDLTKNPFLNGGVKFGQAGFQAQGSFGSGAAGFGGAQGAQGFSANAGQGSGFKAGSSQNSGFSSSSSSQSTGFGSGSTQNGGFGAGSTQNGAFGSGTQGGFGAQGSYNAGASQSGSAFNQGASTGFGNSGFAGNQGSFAATNKFASSGSTGFTGSSPRPFSASTAGTNVNLIQNSQKASEFDYTQQQQTNIEEAFQSTGNVNTQSHGGGDLQQTCAGQGYVCVHKAQCNNGVVNSNGAAVLQAKTSKQYCNIKTEICCRIELSNLSGGNQGSLGVGLATFQGSNQGGLFATGQNTQGSNSFGTTQSGSFGASGQSAQSGSNFGSSNFGASSNRGSGFQSTGQAAGSFGSNSQFGSNSGVSTSFGSTTGAVNRGSTASGFQSQGSFGANKFGSGFSTVAPNKGSSFNEVYKSTSQSNFIETDSSSAGSENVYRPGASGTGLKPGIPYLPPVDSATQASFISSTAFTTQRPFSTPRPTTPRPTYLPPSTSAPTYLPPDNDREGSIYLGPNRLPAPVPRPQNPVSEIPSGCAAALKCTPVEFCTAEGMISNTSVALTREQENFRVPLTDCKNLETGSIGKCCRDPYYTDPWPVNQLGKWVPDVFGGNDGKYTPDNRGSPNNNRPVTGRPPISGGVTRNFLLESKPTIPPQGPNQVTPGFPSITGSKTVQGVRQFEAASKEQYTPSANRFGQGQFGFVGQTQQTQQTQDSRISTATTQFSQQNQNREQAVGEKGVQVISSGGGGFRQGEGQFSTGGRGQLEVTGQTIQNTLFNQIQGQQSKNSGVGVGFGQAEVSETGQGVRIGQGSYVTQGQGKRYEIETQYIETIYRVFLQQFSAGGQCGLLNPQNPFGNRNELEVDFAEIPWQAMVLLQTNRSLLCGGVITRPDVVVTSAACVEGLDAGNVLIKGGEWKLGIDEEPLPFQIVQVKHILRHPFYKRGSLENDAAILVLTENLRFANNIYPICLPGSRDTLDAFYNGAGDCIVTGWGKQVLQAHLAGAVMHSVNVSLINPGDCQAKLSQEYPHLLEQYSQDSCVCGQPTNPTNNICKVDIGSALACTTGDGHYVLRGVYSWDSGCQPGNQLAAFYKFDLEWYEWAIGLIESARFAQFNQGAQGSQSGGNRFSGQINSGVKGGQVSGVKGGSFGQFNQVTSGKTQLSSGQAGFGQGGFGGSGQGGFGASSQGLAGASGQGFSSGSGSGQVKFSGSTSQFSQFGGGQSQASGGQGFGVGDAQFGAKGQLGGVQGQFGVAQGQFGGAQGQFGGAQGQFGGAQGQFGGQFSQSSKYTAGTGGSGFNTQLAGDSGTKTFTATYVEKKVIQSEPKLITFTTKPEVVTYTTKPEYFTFPTKTKIVTYTSKPELIKYETSGSDTKSQYVSFNPSLTDVVKGHTHNAQCKCEGKK